MDMPYHLKTLPDEALDILRYYGKNGAGSAHADEITDGAGLSDRGFGKAIRRLVTKSLLVMDGDQTYRLSDQGRHAVADLLEYDLVTPPEERQSGASQLATDVRLVKRRLVVVAPRELRAGQPTNIVVGFDDAEDEDLVGSPLSVVLRLNVVNGEPSVVRESGLLVENRNVQQTFEVTPGAFSQARVRVQACSLDDFGQTDDSACGGLYIDLPIAAQTPDSTLAAWGADVMLQAVEQAL